jgi:hypothetical protein
MQQEYLNLTAEVFTASWIVPAQRQRVDAGAAAEEAGGKDARIVQRQAIALTEVTGEVAKRTIFPTPFAAIHNQHARSRAIRQRFLCN